MVTLLGHGYIGAAVAKELDKQSIPYSWQSHDNWQPTGAAIINAAGYTGVPNVDACEVNKDECIRGNILHPLNVNMRAEGLPVVHVSSGCIYTGYEKEWTEDDVPNFNFSNGSFYSGCKAMAEGLLRGLPKTTILRVRMPLGVEKHPKNLITKLSQYESLIDQRQSVSFVDDVAKAAVFFSQNAAYGVYNVVNGALTIRQIADAMGWEKRWFTRDEFRGAVVAPRSECVLSSAKINSVFPLRSAEEVLEEIRKSY